MTILCILLPPVAAGLIGGFSSFFINLILTCIGWLPGIIHAYMLMKKAEVEEQNKELTSQINNSETQPEEKTSSFVSALRKIFFPLIKISLSSIAIIYSLFLNLF